MIVFDIFDSTFEKSIRYSAMLVVKFYYTTLRHVFQIRSTSECVVVTKEVIRNIYFTFSIFCTVMFVARWCLLHGGVCFTVVFVARWCLLHGGVCCPVEFVAQWCLLHGGVCIKMSTATSFVPMLLCCAAGYTRVHRHSEMKTCTVSYLTIRCYTSLFSIF